MLPLMEQLVTLGLPLTEYDEQETSEYVKLNALLLTVVFWGRTMTMFGGVPSQAAYE
jgi:hypothetical protein